MNDTVTILRPNPETIIIKHSVVSARLYVAGLAVVLGFWYGWVVDEILTFLPPEVGSDTVRAVLFLVPVLSVVQFRRLIHTSIVGRTYELNGTTKAVIHNGREIASSGDVQRVLIREILGEENPPLYRLSLMLLDRSRIGLMQCKDREMICGLADELADLFNVKILAN